MAAAHPVPDGPPFVADSPEVPVARPARKRLFGVWFPLFTACLAWGTVIVGFITPAARDIIYVVPFTYGACVVGFNLGILKKGPWWVIVANALFLIAAVPLVGFVIFAWIAQGG